MEYFAIANNTVVKLPKCNNINEAISETSKHFKSSLYPAVTVTETELRNLVSLINLQLSIL